jgi:polyphosphate kinase 2 (PPK2 family)
MAKRATKARIDINRFRVPEGGKGFRLKDIDPAGRDGLPDRAAAEAELDADVLRIDELQDVMYAQGARALLCIFQAMDCGGKDGTIRKVFGHVDPIGIVSAAFKKPSERELAQDYLWRVHQVVPPRGCIGIFNRSHYEDVLVVRVHRLAPAAAIEQRYDQINAFEKHLSENGVTILKFFLHISKGSSGRGCRNASTIRRSAGSSTPATSRSGPGGASTWTPTKSRCGAAAPAGRPGT